MFIKKLKLKSHFYFKKNIDINRMPRNESVYDLIYDEQQVISRRK